MVSHDALRLLARHGVGLAAIGEDGVRFYTALPLLPDFSSLARAQATFWADERKGRLMVARRMYALRLGEVLPHRDIAVLRGIEGARMKETYRIAAERARISWSGRRYDRQNPNAADRPNQALNHAASAVEGAAAIAERRPAEPVERVTRRLTGERLRRDGVIPLLIERIKTILSAATSEEVAAPALRKRKEELDSHGADRTD